MEKEFKSKLKGSTPEWDKMKNWKAIEARLPKPKKKRRWFFLLLPFLSIASILLLIGWYFYSSNPQKNNNPILSEGPVPQRETVYTPELSIPGNEDNRREAAEIIKDNENTQRKVQFDYRAEGTGVNGSANLTLNENSENALVSKKDKSAKAGNSAAEIMPSEPGEINSQVPPVLTSSPRIKVLELPSLPARDFTLTVEKGVAELYEEATGITPARKYKPVTLQAYTSFSMPFRQFSGIPVEQEAYLVGREDLETLRQSLEAGILINTYVTPRISISTGIALQRITERLDWESTSMQTVPVLSDTAYYYVDQANNRNYVADTVNAIVTQTRRVKHFNTHTFFNIPLIAGYEKNIGQFTVKATAGPVLQFYRGFEGRIIDENEQFITGDELRTQGVYKNKAGFSLQAGLGVSRPVGRLGRLHAGIQYRHGLLSVADASAGYNQTYNSIGLNLGWSIRLFR